ncbi:MAG: uracil-DNA glycosylase family protein [Flavobacteriaceae bacterium]|nr:uracil-DNA glycosylase family protein [Flavobacteriaceae bacterium]
MFLHTHPYPPFLFHRATKMIVGTLPPPRFTQGELKPGDVNFCYGSRDGQLWRILDTIFDLNLSYETSEKAIEERKQFLHERGIAICDIVESARRQKVDASDLGMKDIELRDIVGYLREYPNINTLLFTGGNSANGPEYLFRKQIKEQGLRLKAVVTEVPRIHEFQLDLPRRTIRTVSLTAPSGAANRAVGSMEAYKAIKAIRPDFNTFDFRVMQYKSFF